MKKTISILAACMLVFSFAGIAAAQDLQAVNCGGEAGYIERGCEMEQQATNYFDFDQLVSAGVEGSIQTYGFGYCEKANNRAIFPVCDCPFAPEMVAEAVYELGMEILIDKDGDGVPESVGDNGVYWHNVPADSIAVNTYGSQTEACSDYSNANAVTSGSFMGPFDYMPAAADTMHKTAFKNTPLAGGGYEISLDDDLYDASNWVIDIPPMFADMTQVESGWDVYVKVCIYETGSAGGICADCESCCFLLKVGTLCCPEDTPENATSTLIFPYLGKTDGAWWNGIAVTNLTDNDGTADVTLYEGGDAFTGTIEVDANGTAVIDMVNDLELTTAGGDGVMGNERAYAKVVTNGFTGSGFAMMAKESNGVSMGYLAEKQ